MKSGRPTLRIIDSLRSDRPATRELRLEAATRLEEYEAVYEDMARRIAKLTKQIQRMDTRV